MHAGNSGRRALMVLAVAVAALAFGLGGTGAGADGDIDAGVDEAPTAPTTAVVDTAVPDTTVPDPTVPGDVTEETVAPTTVAPAPSTPGGPPTRTGERATPVAEGESPNAALTIDISPTPVRRGRTVTITATLTNSPVDLFRPAEVWLSDSGKVGLGRIVLSGTNGGTLTGRLRLEATNSAWVWANLDDPELYFYSWFADGFLDVISGYGATVSFTITPSQPAPGSFAVVEAQVTATGGVAQAAAGIPRGGVTAIPSGEVTVRSGSSVVATGQLNGQGRAVVPIIVPGGAPLSVAYTGDDLFVPVQSTVTVTPAPPPPPPPPPVEPPAEEAVEEVEEEAVPTTVAPPTTVAEEDDEEEVADDGEVAIAGDEGGTDEGEEVAAGSGGSATQAERTTLVRTIPTPGSVEWSPGQVAANAALTLLLLLLVAVPATMIDNTIEENYDRIFGAHPHARQLLLRAESALSGLPDGVLLVGISVVAALIFGQLEFDLGWDLTSAVLLLALALVVAIIISVHDLARLPFLERAVGGQAGRLGLYPFALLLAVVLVVLSKLAGFQPGFVFGVLGGLAVSDAVDETDDGRTLAGATVALLGIAFVSWIAWIPVADRVVEPDPGLWTLFLDAFLATLWLTALTSVVFGLAPLRFFDGEVVRKWNGKVWLGLWVLATFLLVQVYIHPSAGRWGGVDSNTMRSAFAVFGVFFLVGVAVWAWFRFRPDPREGSAPPPEEAAVGA